jgi:putative tricarboxylic transport membrane protein
VKAISDRHLVRVLKTPYAILYPLILLVGLIGVYSLNTNVVEITIMLAFGLIGCLMRRSGYEGRQSSSPWC